MMRFVRHRNLIPDNYEMRLTGEVKSQIIKNFLDNIIKKYQWIVIEIYYPNYIKELCIDNYLIKIKNLDTNEFIGIKSYDYQYYLNNKDIKYLLIYDENDNEYKINYKEFLKICRAFTAEEACNYITKSLNSF